jgi:glutamate synthase (ferredoxin)
MSHGSLSAEAHQTIAIALNRLQGRSNSGEGGEDPERFRTDRNSAIKQVASGRFGVTPEYAAYAKELQIKIAQGSKPGEGGQLPGHKVTAEIARLRHTTPGVALISPPPHHDIYSIEDLAQLIFDLRQVNPDVEVSVKLVAEAGVGVIASGVAKALADIVHIAGCDGGTGASPLSSIKNAGLPWELGLAETQQALVASGLRGRIRVRVDGGFKTGRDVLIAALLGADEVSFGTALLLAEGCLMVRSCHLDTCPVGIATQRPELRSKFAATPEQVEAYLLYVAEELRRLLASLGLRYFEDAVGRVDLLRRRSTGEARADLLDVTPLLAVAGVGPSRYAAEVAPRAAGGELGETLARDAQPALEEMALVEPAYAITNSDRTVGARLGGLIGREHGARRPPGRVRARFHGVAGQSFGAFLAAGVYLDLVGEANDYVGKAMGGGRIVVRPPAGDAGNPVLIGNTALYGATGGELFCAGRAGERFAVRNSGAVAVVEGVGDHACEYMTNGTVVVLGEFGRNVGAGMSGGSIYVYDAEELLDVRLNGDLVVAGAVANVHELRRLLERHVRYTDSARARRLLARWDESVALFRQVVPKSNVAQIEDQHEGTLGGAEEAEELAASGAPA